MKLSIILVTYNHEIYIRKALESIYNQIFDFSKVEIIIADDYSTDSTIDIIKSLEHKFPAETKIIYLDRGGNIGITKNYQSAFENCKGEYVAVMEGDDYWTSPYRLQKMVNVLEDNFHVGMVSNNYYVYNQSTKKSYLRVSKKSGIDFFVAPDLVKDNLVGNFSTCMYRKTELELLPSKLFEITSYDWIISICITSNSYLAFMNEPMSIYRVHENGVWSSASEEEKIKEQLETIKQYDQLTDFTYSSQFSEVSSILQRKLQFSESRLNSNLLLKSLTKKIILSARSFTPPFISWTLRMLLPPIVTSLLSKVR
ncbi:glycosyltransferase [Vibrio toranzoniae]|uniref:glycosyltransferase n=1 Tax=Vibrio toranzoniae TaxID=1194427 RepID=UPI001376BBB2|nr:glycosyltransferase [Vibrio toranzoniae]NAZ91665.1 glycosyltransferase [Vibrio toranzoniae]